MTTYILSTDYIRKNFSDTTLTLSCQKMKVKTGLAIVRARLFLYTVGKELITTESRIWVVGTTYKSYSHEITLDEEDLENTAYYQIKFNIYNLSDALSFNHLQLAEGTVTDYHQPEQDIPKTRIRFANSFYANLYQSDDGTYLQVIRPYYTNFDTETLTKSKVTVLAPHLKNEDDVDNPSNIGLEFMNQTDQVIEILR